MDPVAGSRLLSKNREQAPSLHHYLDLECNNVLLIKYRNDLRHENQPKAEERVLQEVVWGVRNKLRGKGKFKKNNVNVEICSNLGIQSSKYILY